jgi:hypothetical protein
VYDHTMNSTSAEFVDILSARRSMFLDIVLREEPADDEDDDEENEEQEDDDDGDSDGYSE